MPGVARQNDINTTGGLIMSRTEPSVQVNGRACAVVGSIISPHAPWGPPHPPHAAATIISGNSTVLVNGKPIALIGSQNTCGHGIISGSGDVIA
jgi:uncharacterized Zn-binding protein involved in type VI secretion